MKKFLQKMLSLLIVGCFGANLAACNPSSSSTNASSSSSQNEIIEPLTISLSISNLELTKGETYQLYATISPSKAAQTILYSSVNENCATINSQGLITAMDKGNTVIRAETVNGLIATCNIEVSIAVGSVSGSMTYSNKSTGTPAYADSGSYIQLIPTNIEMLPSDYSIYKSNEEYGIYTTTTDTSGNFKLTNIPVGEYRLIYFSNNASWHSSKALENLANKEQVIKKIYGEHIGEYAIQQLGDSIATMNLCFYYVCGWDISITKDREINESISLINWSVILA